MKIAIFYFSGTGNTLRVVNEYKKNLVENNIEVSLFSIPESIVPDLKEFDRIGIAYPIHALNAPEAVNKYVKLFPKQDSPKRAFILMCSGEPLNINHTSSNKMRRILRRINLIIDSKYHYIMPYNMIFRHTEEEAYRMNETMKSLVKLDVNDYFINNISHKLKINPFFVPFIWVLRIEQPFAHYNGKRYKIDMNKCIRCMKCVNTCPMHNIEYDKENDKFIFKKECILCTRCSFNCPKDAFNIHMLNAWRVNQPYSFKESEPQIRKHKNYCRRAYKKYFFDADIRIKENG